MKKMVLGVIAVFFMQAGFIAFTSLDRRTAEEAKATPIISDPSIATSDMIVEIEPAYADGAPGTLYAAIPVRTLDSPNRKNIVSRGRRDPSPRRVPGTTANLTKFEPTVIYIQAASVRTQAEQSQVIPARFDQTERQAFSAVTKRSKTRSFFSKSLSVIKTPYRWLKTVGSKIL